MKTRRYYSFWAASFALIVQIALLVPMVTSARTTITVWHPWTGPNEAVFTAMIAAFEQTHPDIKVETSAVPAPEIDNKVRLAIVAGAAPNVAWGFPALQQRLTRALLPLDAFLTDKDKGDIYPGYWQAAEVDGRIYGIPIEANVVAMLFNRDMLKAAGLDEPTDNWSWTDLRLLSIKLRKDTNGDGVTDVYGLHVPVTSVDDPWPWMPWARANGGDVLNREGTRSTINSPAVRDTLAYFYGLIHEDQAMPVRFPAKDFSLGGVGIVQDGPWVLEALERAGVNFGSALLPRPPDPSGPGKKPHNTMLLIAHLYVIKHNQASDQAAVEFVKWFTNTQYNLQWALKTGYTPIRHSAILDAAYQTQLAKRPGLRAFIDGLQFGEARPFWLPYWSQVKDIVQQTVIAIMERRIPLVSGLSDLDQRINAVIRDYAR